MISAAHCAHFRNGKRSEKRDRIYGNDESKGLLPDRLE
jgi:hypothetical protein